MFKTMSTTYQPKKEKELKPTASGKEVLLRVVRRY